MDKNTKYYSSILLKGSFAVTLAESITKIAKLLLLPIFTLYLSPEDFGVASMVSIVITVMILIYDCGLISGTTRLYHDTDDIEQRQILLGSLFYYSLCVPLFFIVLSIFIGPYIFTKIFTNFDFYPYGFLAIVFSFFSQPRRIWVLLKTQQHQIHITSFYSVIALAINLLISVILIVVFGLGVLGKIIAMFPSAIFIFIIAFKDIKKFSKGKWSLISIKRQLKFGFPIIFSIWAYDILIISDRFILEKMTNLSTVGLYSMGYQISQIPLFLILGIRKIWRPIFYENMNKKQHQTLSKLIGVYIFITTLTCIIVSLFSREIFHVFINESFYQAIEVVNIIIIGVFFNALLTLTNTILAYDKQFWKNSKISIFAGLLNIILNIIFIPIYGMKGAAIATVLSYMSYFIISLFNVNDTVKKINMYYPLLLSLVIIILSFYINIYINNYTPSIFTLCLKLSFIFLYFYICHLTKIASTSYFIELLRIKNIFTTKD